MWTICLVTLTIALSAAALADPPPTVRFVFTRTAGAERCPDEETIRAGVAGRLGFEPFSKDADRTITVTVARARRGFAARVVTRDSTGSEGERDVTSESAECGELAAALELAVAIAIDPMSLVEPPGEHSVTQPPTASPPSAPPQVIVVREPAHKPRALASPVHVSAAVGVLASAGSAPGVTAGAVIQGRLRRSATALDVEGRADLPASMNAGGGRVTTSLLQATLAPCYFLGRFGTCALLGGGILRAAGEDLVDARHVSTPLVTVGGRVVWHMSLGGPLWLETRAEVVAPLTRTTLRVDGEAVWSSPPAAGVVGVAIGCDFR